MKTLNGYQIFWGIVEITEGKLTSSKAKSLSKISKTYINKESNYFFFHGNDKIDDRINNVINNMSLNGIHGNLYKITEKQFSMSKNTWDSSNPECPKPFKKSVLFTNGTHKIRVPLTENQLNNVIIF